MSKHCGSKQNIKAVILAGGLDFGRCPLTSRLPTALWPVAGRPVLECVLQYLSHQGIRQAVICSKGDALLQHRSIASINSMQLKFLDGSVEAVRDRRPARVGHVNLSAHIQVYHGSKSDLTVAFNPSPNQSLAKAEPAGIYICEPKVLKYIPKEGYYDIKESLIPEMLKAGENVYAARLVTNVGNFRNREEYLYAIADYLEKASKKSLHLPVFKQTNSQTLWMASDAKVDSSARVFGPVVIMDGAYISKDTVIFGPTILGRNVKIGRGSVVVNSVLWDYAQVGSNCEIQRCVFDYHATVSSNTILEGKPIPFKSKGMLESTVGSALKAARDNSSRLQHALQPQFDKVNGKLPHWLKSHKANIVAWLAASLVLIAFLWSYWPGIIDLWNTWQRSDEYSSGLLVPFLAVYILWSRRHDIVQCRIRPSLWGLFAFLVAQSIRLFGLFFMYGSAERLSITLSIAALVLLLFGWQFFRKVSTVLLFLCLMLPWPNRVQAAVALPLQRWATSSAVFCLEMIGYEVTQEGNIIHIGQATVAVAEACNGLRMITAFFVISGLVILLVKRHWWEKLIVLFSSLPIALLCNTVRLAITAVAFTVLKGEYWEKIFHDFGGYAMMPLALVVIVLELWFLTKITTAPPEKQVVLATK